MRAFRFLLMVLPLILLYSCGYKPKGDNYIDRTPVPPTGVGITIADHTDTLVATWNESYLVKVVCGSRKAVFCRLSVNDAEKVTQKVSSNSFYITPLSYIDQDGIYRLSVDVGINSASGSIGDQMGTEGYLFRKDFILAVLRNQNPFSPAPTFRRENNTLIVVMDVPSNVNNIRKVKFSRVLPGSGQIEEIATVSGTSHYEVNDPLYVGNISNYYLETYIGDPAGSIFIPYVKGGGFVQADLPELIKGTSARGYPLIKWRKTHYTANCGGYNIYEMTGGNTYSLVGSTSNVNDTVFEAAGSQFPGSYLYHVAPVPLPTPAWFTPEIAWQYYSREVMGFTGLSSFGWDRLLTPTGDFLYYTNTSNQINEYSVETGSIARVISAPSGWFYTFSVSPNRKYLLAATGNRDFSYLFYDLSSGQSTLIQSSLVIGAGAETGVVSVSDNGLASIVTGNKVIVYDFLHQNLVSQQVYPVDAERSVISADAQYLFVYADKLHLYKLESGTLQEKWSTSSSAVNYYNFYPSQPHKAAMFINHVFTNMNCETLAVEGSFSPEIDNVCNIDFGNNHLMGVTNGDFKIYDPQTGELQFRNPMQSATPDYFLRVKKNAVYYYGQWKLIVF